MSEFELMNELDAENFFTKSGSNVGKSSDLILFHKHFMLMHVLYTLQDELVPEGVLLTVSPLEIKLIDSALRSIKENQTAKRLALGADEKLKSYYLDWENYTSTTDKNVKEMLNSFWKKLLDPELVVNAFQTLELPVTSSQEEIKKSYRKLAAIHHPDKGGDEEVFIKIQSAFELLRD